MNTQIISVKHRETKEAAKIKIDKDAAIDFENDYVHAPDTSLFVGFDYGKNFKRRCRKSEEASWF